MTEDEICRLRPRNGPLRFGATCAMAFCFLRRPPFFFFSLITSSTGCSPRERTGPSRRDQTCFTTALILAADGLRFQFTPISNAYSRHWSIRPTSTASSDSRLVRMLPVVAAHAFQVLGEVDLEEPNPSSGVKFCSTSSALDERMRFAQTYDPWSEGRTPEL